MIKRTTGKEQQFNKVRKAGAILLAMTLLSGCSFGGKKESAEVVPGSEQEVTTSGSASTLYVYDSVDTATVVKVDAENKQISLRNLETGRQYTLSYSATTCLYDRNRQAIAMGQVLAGDMVDVAFMKGNKTLTTLQKSVSAFTLNEIVEYTISESGRSMKIGSMTYHLADDLTVVSQNELADLMDINPVDELTIQGMDNEIHSIRVEKGHGYLRLEGAQALIGGFVDVGAKVIVPITQDMLLTVPEGSFDVTISYGSTYGSKPVEIVRNQEFVLDVSDLVVVTKYGQVVFDLMPAEASVYIDGEKQDATKPIELTYGLHVLIVKADGYKTVTKYLSVAEEMATLSIELEKDTGSSAEENEENSGEGGSSENTQSGEEQTGGEQSGEGQSGSKEQSGEGQQEETETVSASEAGTYYVTIEAPEGAEVYVDGTYIGIAPVKFKKDNMSHIVSLRKSGFQTRSYTIDLDDEKKDVSYSFSELISLEG